MESYKVYDKGVKAYKMGTPFSDCPYPKNSLNAIDWEEGFLDTETEDEECDDEYWTETNISKEYISELKSIILTIESPA